MGERTTRRTGAGLACIAAAALAVGCGLSELDASTSCKEFMAAPPDQQDQAVSKVASEKGANDAVTPLGRPNINYLCASSPNLTLGEAVEKTG